jgi:predicted enzyme related to lactoylglutathione lyase
MLAKCRLGAVCYYVNDVNRTEAFYRDVLGFAEGGIDDMVSELAGKGVTIVTPVSHAPGGWSAEFKDLEGHVLSMYQPADKPRKR